MEKVCTDARVSDRKYGIKMTAKIHQRIYEISASDSVETLMIYHIGRCHALSQNRKGQYAMDLVHPYRLIFEKAGTNVHIVQILEIVDYR